MRLNIFDLPFRSHLDNSSSNNNSNHDNHSQATTTGSTFSPPTSNQASACTESSSTSTTTPLRPPSTAKLPIPYLTNIEFDTAPTSPDNMPSKPALDGLPNEVYEMICNNVESTKELKALRETNRMLHQQTEIPWVKRMFVDLRVTLDRTSLEYLESVARNKKYSNKVQTIVVEAGIFTYEPANAQEQMEASECAKALGKALELFKNATSIKVAPWTRGDRAIAKVGVPFPGDRRWIKALSDAFKVVVRAMEHAGPSIRHMKAGTTPINELRNSVSLLDMPTSPRVATSMAHLESLHLVLEGAGVQSASLLSACLSQCRGLKSLRLEFWAFYQEWLSQTLEEVDLPLLQNLHLEAARKVPATSLRDFVQRHKDTLTDLSLILLSFQDDELATIFPGMFEGLRLRSVHLQQLVSQRSGLLLFGSDTTLICETCYKDLDGVWRFRYGPACEHATMIAKGETEVNTQLQSRMNLFLLPWRPARYNWDHTPEPEVEQAEDENIPPVPQVDPSQQAVLQAAVLQQHVRDEPYSQAPPPSLRESFAASLRPRYSLFMSDDDEEFDEDRDAYEPGNGVSEDVSFSNPLFNPTTSVRPAGSIRLPPPSSNARAWNRGIRSASVYGQASQDDTAVSLGQRRHLSDLT